MSEAPVVRRASRVLLLDSADRIFLMFFAPGQNGAGVWITPGGGLEPGETFEEAAVRELAEEVGLLNVELGPCVWLRSHSFEFDGKRNQQQERFYVVRVDAHDPGLHINSDEWERERITSQRWWALDQIVAASHLHFAPRDLAALLAPIIETTYPEEPLLLGL